MIITIAGIKRSGSTVQFNLVRIALQEAGYQVNVCGHDYVPRKVPKGEVDLVKRHKFSRPIAEAADHIFLTDRPDNEIMASLRRFNGRRPKAGRLVDMRKSLALWEQFTSRAYLFYYRDWEQAPMVWAQGVVGALRLDVDPDVLLLSFQQITPPEEGQDPETLLFHNHITS